MLPRHLLLISVAGALALGACGGDSDSADIVRSAGADTPTYSGPAVVDGCEIKPGTRCDADFSGVDLSYADLSGARFGGMRGARWENVNLTGANLTGAEIGGPQTSIWRGVNLSGANLSGATLFCVFANGMQMPDTNFSNARLQGVDFGQANLSGANFTNAELQQADFYQADLSNTKFNGAQLLDVSLIGAAMDGADTSWAEAAGTFLPDGQWASGFAERMEAPDLCSR